MTKLKSSFGYILCIVSTTESGKRKKLFSNAQSSPTCPPCQLDSTAPSRETHRYSLWHKDLTYMTQSQKPLKWHTCICVLCAVAKSTVEGAHVTIYCNPSIETFCLIQLLCHSAQTVMHAWRRGGANYVTFKQTFIMPLFSHSQQNSIHIAAAFDSIIVAVTTHQCTWDSVTACSSRRTWTVSVKDCDRILQETGRVIYNILKQSHTKH